MSHHITNLIFSSCADLCAIIYWSPTDLFTNATFRSDFLSHMETNTSWANRKIVRKQKQKKEEPNILL